MTDYYNDHNPLLWMFGNLNIYHSFFIQIFPNIILSVNCLQICRWTVSNFVGELSAKYVSVNCLWTTHTPVLGLSSKQWEFKNINFEIV